MTLTTGEKHNTRNDFLNSGDNGFLQAPPLQRAASAPHVSRYNKGEVRSGEVSPSNIFNNMKLGEQIGDRFNRVNRFNRSDLLIPLSLERIFSAPGSQPVIRSREASEATSPSEESSRAQESHIQNRDFHARMQQVVSILNQASDVAPSGWISLSLVGSYDGHGLF